MATKKKTEETFSESVEAEVTAEVEAAVTGEVVTNGQEETGTEVAEVHQGGTSVSKVMDRKGFEKLDAASIKLPTAKLLQQMSPEVVEAEFEDYGFAAGQLIHSILYEELEPKFVPLMIFDDNIMFVPRNKSDKTALETILKTAFPDKVEEIIKDFSAGNVLCRSKDGKRGDHFGNCATCPYNKFQGDTKPWCTKNVNVLALFEGQQLPVIIRFSNTSFKHGEKFKNTAFYAGGDLYSRMYKVKPKQNKNDDGVWYEMAILPAGYTTPELYSVAADFHDMYINTVVEAIDAEEQTHTASSTETYDV